MKNKTYYYYLFPLFLFFAFTSHGQTLSEKKTVSAKVTSFNNSVVNFEWSNFSIQSTDVYRKKTTDINWSLLSSGNTTGAYSDSTFNSGEEYEYKFHVHTNSNPSDAYGYLAFGVNVPQKTSRGDLLILVDDRFSGSLEMELIDLQLDLKSDGWNTILEFVNKDSSVFVPKSIIDYHDSVSGLESVYIIGHVPVPYSGFTYPDGHSDHAGAWPTDLFYVTDKDLWSDYIYNTTNNSRPQNSNHHFDEKFDNSYIPEKTFAAIARVDFYDLPSSPQTELAMLQNYLNQASAYKRGTFVPEDRGVIHNQTANFGEGFATNGHINMCATVGDSVDNGDLMNNISATDYKWIYASAFSNDTTLGTIGSISDFHQTDYNAVFGMTFGSYFGDWNTTDNLMRSMMANGKMLTNCWAGRPNWFFHQMGLNNAIGASAQKSINNKGFRNQFNTTRYDHSSSYDNGIHMALLGDPSLRNNYNPVIQNLSATYNSDDDEIDLTWTAISTATSYEVYKSSDSLGAYTLLTSLSGSINSYTDVSVDTGNYYYIKYTSLDTTLSGTYYNNSVGSYIGVQVSGSNASVNALPVELLSFTAVEQNKTGFLTWQTAQEIDFSHFEIEKSTDLKSWVNIGEVKGAGNSSSIQAYSFTDFNLPFGKTYYRLKQVDFDLSFEYSPIKLLDLDADGLTVYPNPSSDNKLFLLTEDVIDGEEVQVLDLNGKEVGHSFDPNDNSISVDGRAGIYTIKLKKQTKKVVLL